MSKKGLDFKLTVMNKRFLLIAVMLLASLSGFAQAQFSLYGGGAFPMGKLKAGELKNDFPEKWALINEKGDQGFAGIGFNVGMDVLIPIDAVDGFGITIGADFFYNGYNSELKDYISDYEDACDENYDSYTLKKPRIMNIPVLVGARYLYDVSDGFGLFGEVGLGANIRMITPMKLDCEYTVEEYYGTYDVEESDQLKYKTAVTFAYRLGVGMMLADHFSIGFDYYGLGGAKVTGTETDEITIENISETEKTKFKSKALNCSEFAIRLGYHF